MINKVQPIGKIFPLEKKSWRPNDWQRQFESFCEHQVHLLVIEDYRHTVDGRYVVNINYL